MEFFYFIYFFLKKKKLNSMELIIKIKNLKKWFDIVLKLR
jgi:hypothetical protein